jgi:ferredoxin
MVPNDSSGEGTSASRAPLVNAESPERISISLEGYGAGAGYCDERVLVALERAQGMGKLRNMPRRLPVGCRRGGCGICRVKVLAGEYRKTAMSRTHVSFEDEAEGVVLACCIYPLSDLSLRLEEPIQPKWRGQTFNEQNQ